jgi:hypothetical protein
MSKEFLAALLVLTVLLCHGVFGVMHQFALDPPPSSTRHLTHGKVPAEEGTGIQDMGMDTLSYVAVLVSILLALILWRCLVVTAFPRAVSVLRPVIKPYPFGVLYHLRGPTSPLLQVFRL